MDDENEIKRQRFGNKQLLIRPCVTRVVLGLCRLCRCSEVGGFQMHWAEALSRHFGECTGSAYPERFTLTLECQLTLFADLL